MRATRYPDEAIMAGPCRKRRALRLSAGHMRNSPVLGRLQRTGIKIQQGLARRAGVAQHHHSDTPGLPLLAKIDHGPGTAAGSCPERPADSSLAPPGPAQLF
ncbi:hypothetical protein MN608_08994 [Microdochium nivale]|nr:hypothetical protein MN608_08994 [Microdochium nivale]